MRVLRSERREKNDHAVEAGAFISSTISNERPETPGEFDYDTLKADDRSAIRQHANEIRGRARRMAEDIREIGTRLIDVRSRLKKEETYTVWLACEFPQWSPRTAYNFVYVAERYPFANFAELPGSIAASALYDLSSPSAPVEAGDEALERAQAGETITHAKAEEIIDRHKAKNVLDATEGLPPAKRAQTRQIVQDAEDKRRASRGEALVRKGMEEFAGMGGDGQVVCEILERLLAHLPDLLSGDAVGALKITTVEAA